MIVHLLRKPMTGSTASNALAHGAGCLNIDGCRVGGIQVGGLPSGRWPANLLHDDSEGAHQKFPVVSGGSWTQTEGMRPFSNEGSPTKHIQLGVDETVAPASRFFEVFSWDYLTKLISTPVQDLNVLRVEDPLTFDWAGHEDLKAHGIVVTRGVGDAWQAEALRVLKPGGYLLIASADDVDPTGSDCTCIAEDSGFEVRDSIFVVTAESDCSYTSKAGVAEKKAGTFALDDGSNSHPTVKPIEIMAWCLEGLPEGSHVVDPFLGSGTTGIACLNARLDFTGIDITPEYLPIADARMRHWNSNRNILEGRAVIYSDCDTTVKPREVGFDDFFGLEP